MKTKPGIAHYLSWSLYVLTIVPTAYYAVQAMLPCKSNFEGGCAMGKMLLLLMTMIPSVFALALGFVLRSLDPPGSDRRVFAIMALLLPVAYMCLAISWAFTTLMPGLILFGIILAITIKAEAKKPPPVIKPK